MFNFDVNWNNFIWQNLWPTKRKAVRYAWLKFLFTPIKYIHSKFLLFKDEQIYLAVHTGQKIYLEKLLNDQFDNDDRGIYIGLISGLDKIFLKQKAELLPIYIYDKWDISKAYVIGNFAVYGTSVWVCTANNIGSTPFIGSSRWSYYKDRMYLAQKSEYNPKGFIVYVPVGVAFDEVQMRAYIELYKLAGMYYEIQTY